MKTKYFLLFVIATSIIVLDQWTKELILADFQQGDSVNVITHFFNITYVRNPGAAFGIFRTLQEDYRHWFFLLMPPFAMTIIFFMLKSTPSHESVRKWALCLVFGGALGNYIDRLRFGYVVDFLDFHYYDFYTWPAFNVADISIVLGVTLMIILELILVKEEWLAKKNSKITTA